MDSIIGASYDVPKIGTGDEPVASKKKSIRKLKLKVPTWYELTHPEEVERGEVKSLAKPHVPVEFCEVSGGVLLVLGSGDKDGTPELSIERQTNGWLITLRAEGAFGRPGGYVYFLDGGETYLMRDDATTICVLPRGNESPYSMRSSQQPDG